jgi:Xaa-Pro aminopeptidase
MLKRAAVLVGIILLMGNLPAYAQEYMYGARREALMRSIDGGVAILFSDASPGQFDKGFYYLTGLKTPGAALVLLPGREVEEVLFNASGEWDWAARTPTARAHPIEEFSTRLSAYGRGLDTAYVSFQDLQRLTAFGRGLGRLSTLENVDAAIAGMRVIKDESEIEFLRRACQTTAEGLNDVFMAVESGMQEEDLSVLLEFGFKRRKSPGYSFLQAASGPNATNVHFGAGERVLEDGDVIVFDVGAVWEDYTADISRTIPVSGRFSEEQREIYTVVLNSQKAAIRLMKPGALMSDVRAAAEDALIDGLSELGLVLDKENQSQRRFFIAHGYYHFIGLDIHDVWSEFSRSSGAKVYEPGMVMTMEPGLYFPRDRLDLVLARLGASPEEAELRAFIEEIRPTYEKYVDIGVRIEDDVLITDTGNEVLTAAVPKEIDEIEEMMGRESPFYRLR